MKDECNSEVFAQGESVGIVDMTKEQAEAYCKKMTAESDYTYDWHYAMGRPHIMRLKKGFVKEDRYIVIKNKDLEAINVTREEAHMLMELARRIREHRESQGKKPLEGVFIESDWKCHDAAWKLVRQEWENKQ